MTLRTPRRRISPQTRRRCRAIKGFFKRALGSLSQPDLLQITSSIAVNVTDINHKILGLEQQLDEVCKTCRDNIREINSAHSKSPNLTESRNEISQRETPSAKTLKRKDTKILYSKLQNQSSVQSNSAVTTNNESNRVKSDNTMNKIFTDEQLQKLKKKKSKINNKGNVYDAESKNKTELSYKNVVSSYSASSFHSLDQFRKMNYIAPGFSGDVEKKNRRSKVQNDHYLNNTLTKPDLKTETTMKNRKSRHKSNELDSDFIADIIRRQYKPIKFGRRNSDLSQFSAPVCRDREGCLTTDCYNIPEHQLCNCGECHYSRHSDFSDIRSVYDARLYNVKRNTRKRHRKKQADIYDNSDIYDLVPVKEKSSPKSRRRFIEDNMRCGFYKEVPPSPRTHRPRLNLKARYAESECTIEAANNSGKRIKPKHAKRHREMEENYQRSFNRNDVITPINTTRNWGIEEFEKNYDPTGIQTTKRNNNLNQADCQSANSICGIYPTLPIDDHIAPVETPLNKTQETVSSDKTDKALCEIKDILQSFLLEIKNESSYNQRANISANKTESGNSPLNNANTMTSNRQSFSNFHSHCPVAPSPFVSALPGFGNTCCYPLLPMCPMNCMQNSYAMTSASFTQNHCVEKCNETCNSNNDAKIDGNKSCETDELIKEIYKFVSQSPTFCRKRGACKGDSKRSFRNENKVLTSRSVGDSTRLYRQDAKVGTRKTNCVSKSCEAIKVSSAACSSTNPSYSETVLDKLSLDTTQSSSEPESSTEASEVNKVQKRSKFARVLQSLGLSKKMKKDIIEELSESETTTTDDVKKPPFHQRVTNYAMHGQEYYSPPPVSPYYRPQYPSDCRPPYNPDIPYGDPRSQHTRSHSPPRQQYGRGECPSAPPYPHPYDGYTTHPQVPLCLKEVEVKSIGCQSENKISFFRKITQKMQQPATSARKDSAQRNGSTQTSQNKPGLFSWKNPQLKMSQINPQTFGYQTQKKLLERDKKMKNAMLKKMFYKRNPFSPRNLIVKTLLGKDKSSFGDPPAAFRQRMFM